MKPNIIFALSLMFLATASAASAQMVSTKSGSGLSMEVAYSHAVTKASGRASSMCYKRNGKPVRYSGGWQSDPNVSKQGCAIIKQTSKHTWYKCQVTYSLTCLTRY